jgi:glutamate dehydrogenase (NADP+)
MDLKNKRRGRIKEYAGQVPRLQFRRRRRQRRVPQPAVDIKADCAFPSATQNEINKKDAANLIKNGCKLVSEGANMPSTADATNLFLDAGILYGPGQGGERRRRGHLRPRNERRTACGCPGRARKWTSVCTPS